MSLSDATTTFSKSFDASSQRSTPASTSLTSTYPNFDAYMRKTYPNALTGKFTPLPVSRRRHSKSNCKYICLLCNHWSSGNRTHANEHLIKVHFPHASKPDLKQPSITSVFNTMSSTTSLRHSFDKQRYKEGVVGLLTRRRVPFSLLEWEEFKDICLACNPDIEDLLISSRRQAIRLVLLNYQFYRCQIKKLLQEAAGPIHLSTDLWTSPHRHAMLAICAQWVDKDYTLRKALIGLPECKHDHSREHQAELIFDYIQDYDIKHNLGCHTSDNASSNDTCVISLQKRLSRAGVNWDATRNRMRCLGHVINLSLQAFLFAKSKKALQAAIDTTIEAVDGNINDATLESFARALARSNARSQASQLSQAKAKRNARSKRESTASIKDFGGIETLPTLQKLHKLAVWIKNSSLHSNLWDEAVGLRLGINNATRWSSWFTLIGKALKKQTQIKAFMSDREQLLQDIKLTTDDWELLGKAHAFLQPFAGLTLVGEGEKSSISQVLSAMDALLKHYEQEKEIYSNPKTQDSKMLHSIDMGWFLLDKYYHKTDEAPIYAAALLLDPMNRAAYLWQNWPNSWVEPAIASASKLFKNSYKHTPSIDVENSSSEPPSKRPRNKLDGLKDSLKVKRVAMNNGDDFRSFVEGEPIEIGDYTPLEWWCRPEQRARYPQLSKMAIAILSISPESAEAERAFSGARRTCSWDRLRLRPQKVEIIESLGSWIREGLIKPTHLNGLGLPIEPEGVEEDEAEECTSDDDMEVITFLDTL